MKIARTRHEKPTLFTKGNHAITISGVTLEKADELFETLMHLRMNNCEKNSSLSLTIITDNFSGGDLWETQSDCEHFLVGYELAMRLNGKKIEGRYWG